MGQHSLVPRLKCLINDLLSYWLLRGVITPGAIRGLIQAWRLRGVCHGRRVFVGEDVLMMNRSDLILSDDVMLSSRTTLSCTGGLSIGNRVMIGPGTVLITTSHDVQTKLPYARPISIEDNVWIAASVTVIGGVTIGHDSVIAAGAVVTRDIPPNCVAGGVPARVLKTIENANNIRFKAKTWIDGF
jgi:maltose O-acetyltransferase